MPEIEVFDSKGQMVVDAKSGEVKVENLGKNRKMKKWMMSKVFEIKEKERKFEYIAYFRASRYSGGRAEQFVAVYKGTPESPKKFANQVKEVMQEADQKSEENIFYKMDDEKSNFLAQFAKARASSPRKYRDRKVERELEKNKKINFKAPDARKAAQAAKWIEKLELDSKDINFSLSVLKKKRFNSEVNILIDKTAKTVEPYNKEAKKAQTTSTKSDYRRPGRKTSGPGAWLKSKIPGL